MNNDYIPIRSSAKTVQNRLIGTIDDLQKRLANAQAKSLTGVDPNFQRLSYTLGKKLDAAREKLQTFNSHQNELEAFRSSVAAKEAEARTAKFAAKFEKALLAAVSAAAELTTTAADLADILHVVDPGLWPSRSSVNDAIRSRVITVFGDLSTIKLDGYGTSGKKSMPLTNRFKSTQEK